jgi:outer membrane biosynthesis protein TonB
MDNKQTIHIACEGILIGGLSLYFAKQLKQQHKEIEELKTVIAKNQASNEKRFEVIFNFLDNINGGFAPSRQPVEDRVVNIQQTKKQQTQIQPQPKPIMKKQPPKQTKIDEEELKRLPQKKKVKIQTVEEPSVLENITKKNSSSSKEEVCDPNDENCDDDIKDEMGTLLEVEDNDQELDESVETDMEA